MLSFQTELCPELPPVVGNRDFHDLNALLRRVNELIVQSGLEQEFVASFALKKRKTQKQRKRLVMAFRCTLIRFLFQLPYRHAARELAVNYLYQKFCNLIRVDQIITPSHSTLERFEKMVPAEILQELAAHLNHGAAMPANVSDEQVLGLEAPVDLGVEYIDATALKARVHYPVDWILLRDVVRTLTLAITQARKRGILSRMPKAPEAYLSAMNKLCIQMSHARRTKDAKKTRKKTLRRMKKLVRVVEKLACGHLSKLRKQGAKEGLGVATIIMLEKKFTVILEQIDAVIHQAHERIIGERRVKSKDKIISLYESDMHVIVRGKSDAEVEFGNTLFLAEQANGLIIDWHLYKEQAPADSRMLPDHLERTEKENGIDLESLTGDRGFDSAANTKLLADNIQNNICPRNIQDLNERLRDKEFRAHQTRRAQTEARIAIIMHGFFGNPARKWGYKNKARLCAWGILTHNLWVLARLPQQETQAQAA
jgi:Transposase domain (DUF772)